MNINLQTKLRAPLSFRRCQHSTNLILLHLEGSNAYQRLAIDLIICCGRDPAATFSGVVSIFAELSTVTASNSFYAGKGKTSRSNHVGEDGQCQSPSTVAIEVLWVIETYYVHCI